MYSNIEKKSNTHKSDIPYKQHIQCVDNRPKQVSTSNLINGIQRQAVAQLWKIEALKAEEQELIKSNYEAFKKNLSLLGVHEETISSFEDLLSHDFQDSKKEEVLTILDIITKKPDSSFAPESTPLPPLVEESNKLSNIQMGVNGFFDLELEEKEEENSIVNVIVKLKLAGSERKDTLDKIKEFWSKKNVFEYIKEDSSSKRYDVNIIIKTDLMSTEKEHYNYVETTEGQPQVTRGKDVIVHPYEADKEQKSAFHEFGHIIGLGEEYDLDSFEKNSLHHEKMLQELYKSEYFIPTDEKEEMGGKRGSNTKSIMGKGSQLFGRHYIGILKALCQLKKTEITKWKILIPDETS